MYSYQKFFLTVLFTGHAQPVVTAMMQAYDIAVDVDGNPVITGSFTGSANFEDITLDWSGFP
jgi:hypothetical protein